MRRYIPIIALALLLPLGACSGIPLSVVQQQAEKVEQVSKPRQRVETLARVLKDTKEGLAAEFRAGRITQGEFVSTEAPVQRAAAALDQAGQLLHAAADERALAAAATGPAAKIEYEAVAAANEALAIQRTNAAEADIAPLRAILNRARGVPVAVLVKP